MKQASILFVITMLLCCVNVNSQVVDNSIVVDLLPAIENNHLFAKDLLRVDFKEELKKRYDYTVLQEELNHIRSLVKEGYNGSAIIVLTLKEPYKKETLKYIKRLLNERMSELGPFYRENIDRLTEFVNVARSNLRLIDENNWDSFIELMRPDVRSMFTEMDVIIMKEERELKGVKPGKRLYHGMRFVLGQQGSIEMVEICFIQNDDHLRNECITYSIAEGKVDLVGFHHG